VRNDSGFNEKLKACNAYHIKLERPNKTHDVEELNSGIMTA
jgi:hypothetical protein